MDHAERTDDAPPPPDVTIMPATRDSDVARADELVREHGWEHLRRDD